MHRRFENAPDSAKTKALQTVIEMKVSENKESYESVHTFKRSCTVMCFRKWYAIIFHSFCRLKRSRLSENDT